MNYKRKERLKNYYRDNVLLSSGSKRNPNKKPAGIYNNINFFRNLHFIPEDGVEIFLWNIGMSSYYMA
jgi:hypothetical protein